MQTIVIAIAYLLGGLFALSMILEFVESLVKRVRIHRVHVSRSPGRLTIDVTAQPSDATTPYPGPIQGQIERDPQKARRTIPPPPPPPPPLPPPGPFGG